MAFQNIVGGQRVYFRQYAGLGRNGAEYKEASGKANPLLLFQNHVVLNIGGRYGTPQVVNAENFIRVGRRPASESDEDQQRQKNRANFIALFDINF